MVIDSIQTVFTERLQSAPGSVAQVRESAAQLVRYAKGSGAALFLVGHVTKEGAIAGPRVLEHMVDTVLYFEGDPRVGSCGYCGRSRTATGRSMNWACSR
jgi:DNA repair protein RadA/Sms